MGEGTGSGDMKVNEELSMLRYEEFDVTWEQ